MKCTKGETNIGYVCFLSQQKMLATKEICCKNRKGAEKILRTTKHFLEGPESLAYRLTH